MLLLILGTLAAGIIILSWLLVRISRHSSEYQRDMQAVRHFLHNLQQCGSPASAYHMLFTYLQKLGCIADMVLYYQEPMGGTGVWKYVSTQDDGANTQPLPTPACFLPPNPGCGGAEHPIPLSCPQRTTHHPCTCFSILHDAHTQSLLQVLRTKPGYSASYVNHKVQWHIELIRPILSSKMTVAQLSHEASTDKLTKLYNRHFLDKYLAAQLDASQQLKHPLSILLIDLDYFKAINDTHGHTAGDYVLMQFAHCILSCIRKTDIAARFGGEEFMVVLPHTDTGTAAIIAERIQLLLQEQESNIAEGITVPTVTCSIGIATCPEHGETQASLILSADAALYEAKRAGRNCIRIYSQP